MEVASGIGAFLHMIGVIAPSDFTSATPTKAPLASTTPYTPIYTFRPNLLLQRRLGAPVERHYGEPMVDREMPFTQPLFSHPPLFPQPVEDFPPPSPPRLLSPPTPALAPPPPPPPPRHPVRELAPQRPLGQGSQPFASQGDGGAQMGRGFGGPGDRRGFGSTFGSSGGRQPLKFRSSFGSPGGQNGNSFGSSFGGDSQPPSFLGQPESRAGRGGGLQPPNQFGAPVFGQDGLGLRGQGGLNGDQQGGFGSPQSQGFGQQGQSAIFGGQQNGRQGQGGGQFGGQGGMSQFGQQANQFGQPGQFGAQPGQQGQLGGQQGSFGQSGQLGGQQGGQMGGSGGFGGPPGQGGQFGQQGQGQGQGPQLVPRELLFGDPAFKDVKLSPDGRWLGFLSPFLEQMNVHVTEVPGDFGDGRSELPPPRPVTSESIRSVELFQWMQDNRTIVYYKDSGGDENYVLTAVDVASGRETPLSRPGSVGIITKTSVRRPFEVAISVNDRDPRWFDAYSVDYRSGDRRLLYRNDRFSSLTLDEELRPRLGMAYEEDGSQAYFDISQPGRPPVFYRRVPFQGSVATEPFRFDLSGRYLYWKDTARTDLGEFVRSDFRTKDASTLYRARRAEISDVTFDPATHTPLFLTEYYDKATNVPLNNAVQPDLSYLEGLSPGAEVQVEDIAIGLGRWLVKLNQDARAPVYYLYDRRRRRARFLLASRPELDQYRLAKRQPLQIRSRDGLVQQCYLTLPTAAAPNGQKVPLRPVPMVLLVHGGPNARDHWEFRPETQLLASRGYGVLQCNFRGSTGFGKRHLNAGNKEWGRSMQTDLADAVQFAIRNRMADPSRVAIVGGSYGGYATLMGLAASGNLFACGVDLFGPSNLLTLLAAVPPQWTSFLAELRNRVGDARTPQGAAALRAASPLASAQRIRKPLLIGQGANDIRVPQNESEAIARAVKANGVPVTYVVFPDEGHGFVDDENRQAFWAVGELFLQQCLGGAAQPIGDLSRSSMMIRDPGDIPQLQILPTDMRVG